MKHLVITARKLSLIIEVSKANEVNIIVARINNKCYPIERIDGSKHIIIAVRNFSY
jgi:hypothetical protein